MTDDPQRIDDLQLAALLASGTVIVSFVIYWIVQIQDVREMQRTLKDRGITMTTEADETTEGPAHFVLTDPDGNQLLFDQHVPSPKR